MNLSKLLNITRKPAFQDRNGKPDPQRAIKVLQDAGYSMAQIRLGLIKMHKLNIRALSRSTGVNMHVIYKAATSEVIANQQARSVLAEALGVQEDELFPEVREGADPGDRLPRSRRQGSGLRSAPRRP